MVKQYREKGKEPFRQHRFHAIFYKFLMQHPDRNFPPRKVFRLFAIFGFIAPLATFSVAVSGLSPEIKIISLALVAFVYSMLFLWTYRQQQAESIQAQAIALSNESKSARSDNEVSGLAALEETGRFFGASFDRDDMFRLAADRIGNVFPSSASILFSVDPLQENVTAEATEGKISGEIAGQTFAVASCLAGLCVLSQEIEIDHLFEFDREAFADHLNERPRAAVALPLVHDGRVFAVYEMMFEGSIDNSNSVPETLEAIRNRITPLFLSSFAADRSLANALSDTVTELPNEKAFFLVLENQLSESIRYRDERPLSVLAIDIKQFADLNDRYGHAAGDRVLAFVAAGISGELRKMDFLARAMNDEFLLILPTADEQTATHIAERIRTVFSDRTMEIADEEIKVWLNFGSATYWADGETPRQLVQHAQLKKQQTKAEEAGNVVWFPKEYVN